MFAPVDLPPLRGPREAAGSRKAAALTAGGSDAGGRVPVGVAPTGALAACDAVELEAAAVGAADAGAVPLRLISLTAGEGARARVLTSPLSSPPSSMRIFP